MSCVRQAWTLLWSNNCKYNLNAVGTVAAGKPGSSCKEHIDMSRYERDNRAPGRGMRSQHHRAAWTEPGHSQLLAAQVCPCTAGRRKRGCSLFPPFQTGSASCRGLWAIQQHSGCSQHLANYIIALSAFTEPTGKGHTIRWCKSVWLCWSHQKKTSSQYLMLRLSCKWWVQEWSSAHLHSDSCSIVSFHAIYHVSSFMQLIATHSPDATQSTMSSTHAVFLQEYKEKALIFSEHFGREKYIYFFFFRENSFILLKPCRLLP